MGKSKKETITSIDLIFISIFVFLFLIVLLDFYRIGIRFLFEQTIWGVSIFGFLSCTLIGYYSIFWGCLKMKNYFRIKEERQKIIFKAFRFIGLTKPSSKDILYIVCSMFVGAIVSIFSLFLISCLANGTLRLIEPPEYYTILQNFIMAPIFEELIYRGIYLSVFLRILGTNYVSAILGITLSSFTFGWIHPALPIFKALGGLVLGSIYLCKWKKNLVASIFAHLGANIVSTFVVFVGF